MKVLWVIGCVCYVISFVGALPTPEEAPKIPDALLSTVFNSEAPVAAPAIIEEPIITPVNGEGSVSAGETISAISASGIDFPPLGETVKSGTDESPAPLPEAFNSPVPPVPLVPTALSQSQVGDGMLNNAILNANLNQQAANLNQQAANLNQQAANLNQKSPFPVRQLNKNGFLATVAGQRSTPTQMSRRIMFSAPTVRNNMQRNVNMISGPSPLATVRRPPIRTSSTIMPIQGSQRMALPSVTPVSGSSPSFFSPTMNPPMPPTNFPSSFISPNEPTFSMVPFVGSDFSSFSFPSSPFSSMPLPSIDPFPSTLEMQPTSVRPISAPQTVVLNNAQMSRRPLPPPTIQMQSPPPPPVLPLSPPPQAIQMQSPPPPPVLSLSPPPPAIQMQSAPAGPPLNIQMRPPTTQVTSFQAPPPPMMSPPITPISTISTGPPLRSAPSSIPVPFVTTPTMMQTTPLIPGPRLTTFYSPVPQVGTNMIAGGLPTFQTRPNIMSGAIRPLPNMIAGGPVPLQTSPNMLPAGGLVPLQTSPNMLPAGGPVPFQTGANMIGGGMPQSFMQPAGGFGDGFGGFQSGESFGGPLGGDMFQYGMPPAEQPSLMSSFNDFFRPIVNAFRSM